MPWREPVDRFSGQATVDSSPTVLFPFTDLMALSVYFAIWVVNDSPTDTLNVLMECSPDGEAPDMDSLTPIEVPPGQAKVLRRGTDEACRYWSISAYSSTEDSIACHWGVTISSR